MSSTLLSEHEFQYIRPRTTKDPRAEINCWEITCTETLCDDLHVTAQSPHKRGARPLEAKLMKGQRLRAGRRGQGSVVHCLFSVGDIPHFIATEHHCTGTASSCTCIRG